MAERHRAARILGAEKAAPPRIPPANRILAALPLDECTRLMPLFRTVRLRSGTILQRHGERIRRIYFPNGGAASIVSVMKDGRMVEVAMVGNEGMIGVSTFFGSDFPAGESVVQVAAGVAESMPVDVFVRELSSRGSLYEVVGRYANAFLSLVMQCVACNGLHSVEERCCRWLLMAQDRIGRDRFRLTHERMSIMLGVRRPTVTVVMRSLEKKGVTHNGRGVVRILDRKRLEHAACECYRSIQAEFASMMP